MYPKTHLMQKLLIGLKLYISIRSEFVYGEFRLKFPNVVRYVVHV